MKAIDTQYKGYLFRSRLEARWAVFFDAVGVRWEYEPEGFDLSDCGWYLPDFYLPELDAWIEIKPSSGDVDSVRKQLIGMIERGPAKPGKAWGFFGDPLSAWWMLPCKHGDEWRDEWPDAGIEIHNDEGTWVAYPTFRMDGNIPEDWRALSNDDLFGNYRAKVKARSARFEHGQKGAI